MRLHACPCTHLYTGWVNTAHSNDDIATAYTVMAYVAMAYIVMAYTVMAYIAMA